MNSKWILYLTIAVAAATVIAEARRVILRQLTADQVYTVLKAAGREDAVPEGRVVTQGLAALTGFSLGIAKGIGGAILFEVATSNTTLEWINSLNLTSLLSSATNGSVTSVAKTTQRSQEICFGTIERSLQSDIQAEGRQAISISPTTPTTMDANRGTFTEGTTMAEPTSSNFSPTSTTGSGTIGDDRDSLPSQTGTNTGTRTRVSRTCLVI